MRYTFIAILLVFYVSKGYTQSPCGNDPKFREFDFWVGTWEAFGLNGKKAGDSKISIILDSCVILEEWLSTGKSGNLQYSGKSFNTFNRLSGQWQQTWVDNTGATTEYLIGQATSGKIIFKTRPFPMNKDTLAVRRLTFVKLTDNKVRQLGEISKDNELTWKTEYDLEYRRKNN